MTDAHSSQPSPLHQSQSDDMCGNCIGRRGELWGGWSVWFFVVVWGCFFVKKWCSNDILGHEISLK